MGYTATLPSLGAKLPRRSAAGYLLHCSVERIGDDPDVVGGYTGRRPQRGGFDPLVNRASGSGDTRDWGFFIRADIRGGASNPHIVHYPTASPDNLMGFLCTHAEMRFGRACFGSLWVTAICSVEPIV